MEKKYYTLKEVMFGLRNEMLINYQLLQKLNESIDICDRKILDIEYMILENNYDQCNPKVISFLKEKKSIIVKFMEMVGIPVDVKETSCLLQGTDGQYSFPNPFKIFITSQEQFSDGLKKIMNSEYMNNISKVLIEDNIYRNSDIHLNYTYITPYTIYSSCYTENQKTSLEYRVANDKIYYLGEIDNCSINEIISIMLDQVIPMENLNEYHRTIIDNSDQKGMEIEIVGDGSSFPLNDSPKVMTLKSK